MECVIKYLHQTTYIRFCQKKICLPSKVSLVFLTPPPLHLPPFTPPPSLSLSRAARLLADAAQPGVKIFRHVIILHHVASTVCGTWFTQCVHYVSHNDYCQLAFVGCHRLFTVSSLSLGVTGCLLSARLRWMSQVVYCLLVFSFKFPLINIQVNHSKPW